MTQCEYEYQRGIRDGIGKCVEYLEHCDEYQYVGKLNDWYDVIDKELEGETVHDTHAEFVEKLKEWAQDNHRSQQVTIDEYYESVDLPELLAWIEANK